MDTTNLNGTTQYQALALIMETAEREGYNVDEHTMCGYNENSGYIWLFDENESYTLAITDFAFNRGECVEFIITCYVNGDEFIGDSLEDAVSQYNDYATDAIKSGDLDADDLMLFVDFD
tara:strand:- start:1361 stop:1717 length:357 start_codon:yes stop_codon:yes gene_type:complete